MECALTRTSPDWGNDNHRAKGTGENEWFTPVVFRAARRVACISNHIKLVVDLAVKNRLPSIYDRSEFVDAGGLMSYNSNVPDMSRRAAIYVDKVLKGANPGDLPVERPTKFEFVINLQTAKQIGLTIPQSVLYRADRVIK